MSNLFNLIVATLAKFGLVKNPNDSSSPPMPMCANPFVEYNTNELGLLERGIDGTETNYPWSEVEHVGIVTTDGGPMFDDFFYLITTPEKNIVISSFQAEKINLLKHFERLPGFNFEAVISAAGCVTNASFDCWDKAWSH